MHDSTWRGIAPIACVRVQGPLHSGGAFGCLRRSPPLISRRDDGIVVRMSDQHMSTVNYLGTAETNRKRELVYGRLREPPSPFFSHQELVLRVARLLQDHVDELELGTVAISPLDVILDADRALVLQPDVLFVSAERRSIIRNQVWGAPDLVAEVFSEGSRTYDRGDKLAWYRQYGVREYWLVDLYTESVAVIDFSIDPPEERIARGVDPIRSSVLPALRATAFDVFA
jgi:Uma2 family endonuclease